MSLIIKESVLFFSFYFVFLKTVIGKQLKNSTVILLDTDAYLNTIIY